MTKRKKYWRYTLPAGFLMTVAVSLGTFPLRNVPLWNYLYGLINERGPFQFITLILGFAILFTGWLRRRRGDLDARQAKRLALAAFIPLGFGLIGYRLGIAGLYDGFWTFLKEDKSMEALGEAEGIRAIGAGVSFDNVLLSVLFFIVIFFPMLNVSLSDAARNTPPDLPGGAPRRSPMRWVPHLVMLAFGLVWIFFLPIVRFSSYEQELEAESVRYAGTPRLVDYLNNDSDLEVVRSSYLNMSVIGERSSVVLQYDEGRDVQSVMDMLMTHLESPEVLYRNEFVRRIKSGGHHLWFQQVNGSPCLLIHFSRRF